MIVWCIITFVNHVAVAHDHTPEEQDGGSGEQAQDFTKMAVVDTMKLYYGWLFPHDVMYAWLAYGNGACLLSEKLLHPIFVLISFRAWDCVGLRGNMPIHLRCMHPNKTIPI